MTIDSFKFALLSSSLLALTACGSGNSSTSAPLDPIGTSGTSLSSTSSKTIIGPISGFDNLTSFDDDIVPEDITGLSDGSIVEISGVRDANGDIRATRIDISDDADGDFEVHGIVENLDLVAMTFNIGDLMVGFAGAELDDFGPNGIQNGDLVEIEGSTFLNDGTFVATEVENENDDEDDREGDDDDEAEISGLVTAIDSAPRFLSVQPLL